jgi:hypothetical protein
VNTAEELKSKIEIEKEQLCSQISPSQYEIVESFANCIPIFSVEKCMATIEGNEIKECNNYDNISFEYKLKTPFKDPTAIHTLLAFPIQCRIWVIICIKNIILCAKSHLISAENIEDKLEYSLRPCVYLLYRKTKQK